MALWASCAVAETTLRIATFTTELQRDGPGLLLRDILKDDDPQIDAVATVIAAAKPDILILQSIDYDLRNMALLALRERIDASGWNMPEVFALAPNSGLATKLDMDGDGRTGDPRDAQGYGEFRGQGGMAVLSRYEILHEEARDYSTFLWRALPGALLPTTENGPFPSKEAQDIQRLSSVGHWVLPIRINGRALNLMTFHATPPVFDGPEDRNGRRNHDEIIFWVKLLDGELGKQVMAPFVLAGNANLDPVDGDGLKSAIKALLVHPRLQDPTPMRDYDPLQGIGQMGDPRLDTVSWPGPEPGDLRVSYVLPSVDVTVTGSGVLWPESGHQADIVEMASRHRLVWVDVLF